MKHAPGSHHQVLLAGVLAVTVALWSGALYLGATQGLDFFKNTAWSIS
eukprot:SAG11_NODE_20210_length_450_cov_1.182336_1_plen_47_part_10